MGNILQEEAFADAAIALVDTNFAVSEDLEQLCQKLRRAEGKAGATCTEHLVKGSISS